MVLPAIIGAALIAAAAHAGSTAYSANRLKKEKKKESRLRAKEAKRETFADLLEQANARRSDLSSMRLANSVGAARKRTNAMQSTAQNFREGLLNT